MGRELEEINWEPVKMDDPRLTVHPDWLKEFRDFAWSDSSSLKMCIRDRVKTEDGWADETMAHMIRCKHCGQIFTCVVNTSRGSGHFKKGKA